MILRVSVRIRSLLISALLGSFCLGGEAVATSGEWSREATLLEYHEGARAAAVVASDGRKRVIIHGVALAVEMEGKRLPGIEDAGVSTIAELAWAPDSRAFFITESYGGEVGEWLVSVYLIENERVRREHVTREVVRRFHKHYRCIEPEEPNVGAITWVKGSEQLLVVAEVPPHSSCPEMGKVRGYLVEVPTGRILQEFPENQLKARWGRHLGQRFSPR